jgi:hypothetical protein
MLWTWRISSDKVCESEPTTNIAGAGNKVIEKDSVYLRRMLGTGLGAFSRGTKQAETIAAIYARPFSNNDAVAKCKSTPKADSHKVGWRRHITVAPSGSRGIDGKVGILTTIFPPLTPLNDDVVIPILNRFYQIPSMTSCTSFAMA